MKRTATEAEKKAVLDAVFAPLESEPPVRVQPVVLPHEHEAILDAQRKIVEVWLDNELNEAGKILHAYKIGFDTGQLVRGNGEVSGAGATASNDNNESATRQRSLD